MLLKKRIGGYKMAKAKPIFVVGTGQEFKSASAAAKALGVNQGNIYSVLSGRRKTAGGMQFGYASNRAVSVSKNGSTQVYSNLTAAARAVKANPTKVENIVSAGIDKTVKGYSFSYVDASRVSAGTNVVSSSAPKTKNRKSNKTAQIKAHKAKKQQKQQRTAERSAKRQAEREEAAKRIQRETQLKNMGESYFNYNKSKSILQRYMQEINDQIDKYIDVNPALLYYNQSTPAVLGMQMYTGYNYGPYDIPYFDTSMEKFALPDDIGDINPDDVQKLADRMQLIDERLVAESTRKGSNFFDINVAEQNRNMLALEFFKNTGHENDLDEYAYMIWDILDVISRANQFKELGSDLIFNMVSDAMQGNIDKNTLEDFIGHIDNWMSSGGSEDELDEILSELDGTYEAPRGFSVFDDDWGWTT